MPSNSNISPSTDSPQKIVKQLNGSWIADLHIFPDLLIDVMESGGILTLPTTSTTVLDRILTPEEVVGIDRTAYGLGDEPFPVSLSYWEDVYRMLGPWEEVQATGELVENAYVSLWRFARPNENSSSFLFIAKPLNKDYQILFFYQ